MHDIESSKQLVCYIKNTTYSILLSIVLVSVVIELVLWLLNLCYGYWTCVMVIELVLWLLNLCYGYWTCVMVIELVLWLLNLCCVSMEQWMIQAGFQSTRSSSSRVCAGERFSSLRSFSSFSAAFEFVAGNVSHLGFSASNPSISCFHLIVNFKIKGAFGWDVQCILSDHNPRSIREQGKLCSCEYTQ